MSRIINFERGYLRVSLDRILDMADPLYTNPWSGIPITVAEVVAEVLSPAEHISREECAEMRDAYEACQTCDIARIAHFVVNGLPDINDDDEPILISVGLGNYMPEWPILDGNHRVAAAIVLGLEEIDVDIDGDWDAALDMFNIELTEDEIFALA